MVDFTSALYLGLAHPSHALRPWASLTTGRPAALAAARSEGPVARKLADLQGCERAVLGASTLHLFWDLFGLLGRRGVSIYLDSGVYPIARWGAERGAGRGASLHPFAHHDPGTLRRLVRRHERPGFRPVVVADGFCPGCGRTAPVEEYLEALRPLGGRLILDDTQALGILGVKPSSVMPYGRGGGGTLRRLGIPAPDVLLISSLAKGFGAPLAVLAGDAATVREFEANSMTRMHCSPPSTAAIHAAERALARNEWCGDFLRRRLACLVRRFRAGLGNVGMASRGGCFPVQTLNIRRDARRLHASLLRQGIGAVLRQLEAGWSGRISFLITARHTPDDIDAAVEVLARLLGSGAERRTMRETTHEART